MMTHITFDPYIPLAMWVPLAWPPRHCWAGMPSPVAAGCRRAGGGRS